MQQQQQQQQQSMSEKRDQSLAINRKEEEEEEMVITKHTASISIGTDFERMIRNAGITTIIFSGIATELGVESTTRDEIPYNSYKQIYDQQLINFLSFHCFRMIGYPKSHCFLNHSRA
jgi:nicotinamidase-related amidase